MKNKMLMTHLVAGYPDAETSLKLALTLAESGADILEIQIPFSDPVADGPTIVAACHTALANGSGYQMSLNLCEALFKKTKVPIVMMTYANIPFQLGFNQFCQAIRNVGVSGLIVPDLPFDCEDDRELQSACRENNIDLIQVISPGTQKERLLQIARCSVGLIYCTTSRGTTGRRVNISKELFVLLKTLRKHTRLPIAVGFGFSSKKDIEPLRDYADIFVVGSAFIKLLDKNKPESFKKINSLVKSIKSFLNSDNF